MMSWIKGLFGRPTKSEVIRDTILALAKDRTLLESASALAEQIERHSQKAVKPEPVPAAASKCVDATARIAELAAKGMRHAAIAKNLNRNGFCYQSKQSNGLQPFSMTNVQHLVNGRSVYSSAKGYYVSSERELQSKRIYDRQRRAKGLKK